MKNLSNTYALANEIRRNIREDISKLRSGYRPDTVIGCGISWLWMLPQDHPWTKVLCIPHDEIFTKGEISTWAAHKWWLENAWKHSPTWDLKLLFFLTLPEVLLWTQLFYSQRS